MAAKYVNRRLKRDLLPRVKDPVAFEMIRALKRAFDSNNILNPGTAI
jgi:FAD/FMN-containing dehydrogenase